MKWIQYFLFIFMASLPLQATEEAPLSLTETLSENHEDFLVQSGDDFLEQPSPSVHDATESYEAAFIKTIVVLVGLLALVILTVWMFKKISHGRLRTYNHMKSVKILEKRSLSPKSMLYLLEVGGKQILIAESQLEVKAIATLDHSSAAKDL